MIDLHCHILPGVDDGAQTIEDSISMAKAAMNEGITHIVATPHHLNGRYTNTKNEIINAVDELNQKLAELDFSLKILPGQETRINGEVLHDYESGMLLTVNYHPSYLFLELPSNHVPRFTKQLIFDMQLKGIVPIIVHPERNQELIERPDKLYELVANGGLTQVTASSITGHFGKTIQRFSKQLIEHNLTHFVASDAHNTTTRAFYLRQAYEEIETTFGLDIRYELQENAEHIVNRETIPVSPPSPIETKKKIFGLF